ncbi:MAG: hypothetical protein RLZZ28_2139 [Bacteroidota bacterium]
MNWIPLTSEQGFEDIIEKSAHTPQLIFKHSTRCGTSDLVLNRLNRAETPEGIDFHLLDLISYRSISNSIAEKMQVYHESPQVLLIKNGECIFDESHLAINMDDISELALKN